MKKANTLLLPLIVLSLTSCNLFDKGGFRNNTKWDDEVARMMWDTTGVILPYIELESDFEYKIIEENEQEVFYLLSKRDEDRCDEYMEILESKGYEAYGVDNTYGYTRYAYSKVIKGNENYIQFDYYPGGYSSKGFEIFSWTEPYVDPYVDYPVISEWPENVKNEMLNKFGELIPVAPFSYDFEYIWVEEDNNFIFTDKNGKYNAFDEYFQTVYSNPEWVFSQDFYQQGYIVFEKRCTNIENGIFHLNMRHSNKTGFIVDVWYTIKNPPVLINEWGDECLGYFEDLFEDANAIPLAPISNEFSVDYAHLQNGYDVIDILDPNPIDDFYSQYISILNEAGFVENEYYYVRFGNHVFEKELASDPNYDMVVDFMFVSNGLSIQIYKEEALGKTGFSDSFPIDQMKYFMSKYQIEYKDFPTFPSDVDGKYLYSNIGPDFKIEIYQKTNLSVTLEDSYKALLEADGWVIDESLKSDDNYWGCFARKEGYDFYLRFFSANDVGVFVFHLYPNSFDCTQGYVFN